MEKPTQSDSSTMTERFDDIEEDLTKCSNIGRTLKIVVFLVCLVGFGYQATEFCTHFMTYPTVVDIEVETPLTFVAPAMTFCNLNIIQRKKYCAKYTDKCEKPPDMEGFCRRFPFYCKGDTSNLMVPKFALKPFLISPILPISAKDTIELFQNSSDFIVNINSTTEEYVKDIFWDFQRFFFGSGVGAFHSCYSVNARFDSELEPSLKKFGDSAATVVSNYFINVQSNEAFFPTEKKGIRFAVHSPFIPVNPFSIGTPMYPGFKYKIHIRLEEDRLLPDPYQTDCIDYIKMWRQNDKTGPRSKQMCESNCQMIFNQECYGCHRHLAVYFEGYEICDKYEKNLTCNFNKSEEELTNSLNMCRNKCKKDCFKLKYPYIVETISETRLELNDLILVSVIVDDPEILVLSHNPQYQNVEIFSYIGGFMGCWLGLSIWAFAGFIGKTCRPMKTGIVTLRKMSSRRHEEQ